MKYRDYTITRSGPNCYIQKPNGERLCAEVPATLATAKKWIDADIRERLNREARR